MAEPRTRRLALAVVIAALTVAALADFLASAHPLVVRWRGELDVLPNLAPPPRLADLDGAALAAQLGPDDWALWPPVRHSPTAVRPAGQLAMLEPPSARHWLGTDDRGRDVMARLIHGARTSAWFALLAALLATGLGVALALGAAADRRLDRVVTVVADAGGALPTLLVVVAVQGLIGGGLVAAAIVVALPRAADTARGVRAALGRALAAPYCEAARALGAGRARVLVRHALPQALPFVRVAAAVTAGTAVLAEAALGFLGFGAAPPTPSWGELIVQAGAAGLPWWLALPPVACVAALCLALDVLAQPAGALTAGARPRRARAGDRPAGR